MHLHQLGNIKSGSTQDLDLPYVHTLQRVDAAALLLNVLTCRHTPLLNAYKHHHTYLQTQTRCTDLDVH